MGYWVPDAANASADANAATAAADGAHGPFSKEEEAKIETG